MSRLFLLALASLSTVAGPAFGVELKVMYPAWNDPRAVAFYDPSCSTDSAPECVLFDIHCDSDKATFVTAVAVEERVLKFSRDGKSGILLDKEAYYELHPRSAEISDLSGLWDLTMQLDGPPLDDFKAFSKMTVNYGKRFTISLSAATKNALAAAMKACASSSD